MRHGGIEGKWSRTPPVFKDRKTDHAEKKRIRLFPTHAAFLVQAMGFVTGSRIAPLGGNHGWTRIHTDPVPWSFGLLCPWSSTSSGTIASGLNREGTRLVAARG